MDAFLSFKEAQKQGWAHFAPMEAGTMMPAAKLAKFAGVRSGQDLLDVACGTGVLALSAFRMGAKVTALDLTPQLLERARENAALAEASIDWREGDVEHLPFTDGHFDVVISQFGHIFAPRPDVAITEMLRVLKSGGTIAFSTWPPDQFVGRAFALNAQYLPAPPPGVSPPAEWGDRDIIRQRLGARVEDIEFESGTMLVPALSTRHNRVMAERAIGGMIRVTATLSKEDPARLARFQREYEELAAEYFADNAVRQDFLMTRATKR
jgi:SAM-dependent methyltransferase